MKLICTIRSFFGAILFIVTTGVLAALGIFLNVVFDRRKFDNWIISTWSRLACFYFNVDVKVFGEENNVRGLGAVVLFNHSSFMDIFAMAGYLYNLRFGAKIELFKIPVFGYCMRRFGILPIARDNREEVFKVYEEAKVRFARGEKFGLSPEGGRFHGEKLYPFKAGPFVFAITAGVPLIPVVIKGAYDVWPKGKLFANSDRWKRTVEVHVLPPVLTTGYTVETRGGLQEKIYKMMNDVYVK